MGRAIGLGDRVSDHLTVLILLWIAARRDDARGSFHGEVGVKTVCTREALVHSYGSTHVSILTTPYVTPRHDETQREVRFDGGDGIMGT